MNISWSAERNGDNISSQLREGLVCIVSRQGRVRWNIGRLISKHLFFERFLLYLSDLLSPTSGSVVEVKGKQTWLGGQDSNQERI